MHKKELGMMTIETRFLEVKMLKSQKRRILHILQNQNCGSIFQQLVMMALILTIPRTSIKYMEICSGNLIRRRKRKNK
jgi:hypothetical protein